MLFNSIHFLVFFPIVVCLYFVLPAKVKNIWLLVSSYYFYMSWNPKYASLILTSTVITYVCALLIERTKRKWILALSITSNLAILFVFKYFFFSFDLISKAVSLAGVSLVPPEFDIVLPVGISFYTFQALSYVIDVYRGEIKAEKNFLNYALFVSFFPQLVAGPIERSKNLLSQISSVRKFDFDNFLEGSLLMIWGFFLKMVIADRIAIFVDAVYGDYNTFSGVYLIVATLLFAVQIYCDFAGYSVIAMGAARILGIKLMENFDAPYFSTSVSEFWRRWHISLTSWFKDYLYIPLGGSRKGKLRKYLNKMIVFFVSGLWHGADLSFVLWGGLNGLYQVIEELLPKIKSENIVVKILKGIITFVLIDFSWIFFRAGGITDSINIIKAMIQGFNPSVLYDGSLFGCGLDNKNFALMMIAILILAVADIFKRRGIKIREKIMQLNFVAGGLIISFSIVFILIFGIYGPTYDAAGFIYFQF